MLVEASREPHYVMAEDSRALQCIVVKESPVPMRGVKDRPMSRRGISGAFFFNCTVTLMSGQGHSPQSE